MSNEVKRPDGSTITAHRYEAGNQAEWLSLREGMEDKIGGSEIGAISNHSDYSNFLKELEYRVGAKARPDISGKIAVKRGHWDEEFVATLFEEASGKKVHRENCIYTNDGFPHLKASIDRKVANERSGLECKTVNGMIMMHYDRDEFPATFLDQCELYLAVTQLDRWYLAILDGMNVAHYFLMTRNEEEEKRYKELRKKFCLVVDEQDPDASEWKAKWAWLDAVYYVDDAELAGCEARATRFLAKVQEVKDLMATQKWNSENERQVMLANVIAQVVDPEDYGEGKVLKEVIGELTSVALPDTELVLDPNGPETMKVIDLLKERKRLSDEIDAYSEEREKRIGEIEGVLKLKMNTAEKAMLPGWKITYKMSDGRRTAKVETVEAYFKAQGEAVPSGLITVGEGSRSLRITEIKPKASARKAEGKTGVVAA